MRQIYTSPRQQNIDSVVALMAENGIVTTVTNRSNYNRASWQRFSYSQRHDSRDSWPQVWITSPDDFTKARSVLREIGIEPVIRHADELAAARSPTPVAQRQYTVSRIRRIVLLAVLAACALVVLRYLHIV
jgi:hypothetical protein